MASVLLRRSDAKSVSIEVCLLSSVGSMGRNATVELIFDLLVDTRLVPETLPLDERLLLDRLLELGEDEGLRL